MRYKLSQAFGQRYSDNRFESFDGETLKTREAYEEYRTGYIELIHPVDEEPYYIALYDFQRYISNPEQTFEEVLAENEGRTISELSPGELSLKTEVVTFPDLHNMDLEMTPAIAGSSPSNEWPFSDRRDLYIRHPKYSGKELYERWLVSINGFFHATTYDEEGLFVLDGYASLRISGDNQLAALDFSEIGALDWKSFDIDKDVHRAHPELSLHQKVIIDLGIDLKDKTVGLCLGGYMHLLDSTMRVISDGAIEVDGMRLDWIARFYDGKDMIDNSDLPLTSFDRNRSQLYVEELYSEEFMKYLLDLPQTFIFTIDTPYLHRIDHLLEPTGLPGRFHRFRKPKNPVLKDKSPERTDQADGDVRYPLICQRGRIKPYRLESYDGFDVIQTDDHRVAQYQFEFTGTEALEVITDHRYGPEPLRETDARLLELGVDKIEVDD